VQFLWAFCFRDSFSCLSLCRQRLQLDLLANFIRQSRWFYDLFGVGEVAFYIPGLKSSSNSGRVLLTKLISGVNQDHQQEQVGETQKIPLVRPVCK